MISDKLPLPKRVKTTDLATALYYLDNCCTLIDVNIVYRKKYPKIEMTFIGIVAKAAEENYKRWPPSRLGTTSLPFLLSQFSYFVDDPDLFRQLHPDKSLPKEVNIEK